MGNVSIVLSKESFRNERSTRNYHVITRDHFEGVIKAVAKGSPARSSPELVLNEADLKKRFHSSFTECTCFQNRVQKYSSFSDTPSSDSTAIAMN